MRDAQVVFSLEMSHNIGISVIPQKPPNNNNNRNEARDKNTNPIFNKILKTGEAPNHKISGGVPKAVGFEKRHERKLHEGTKAIYLRKSLIVQPI